MSPIGRSKPLAAHNSTIAPAKRSAGETGPQRRRAGGKRRFKRAAARSTAALAPPGKVHKSEQENHEPERAAPGEQAQRHPLALAQPLHIAPPTLTPTACAHGRHRQEGERRERAEDLRQMRHHRESRRCTVLDPRTVMAA